MTNFKGNGSEYNVNFDDSCVATEAVLSFALIFLAFNTSRSSKDESSMSLLKSTNESPSYMPYNSGRVKLISESVFPI